MSDSVVGRIEDGVAIITLNRPETSNAMSVELADALYGVVEGLSRDEAVRAWLFTAHGKNFCGGGDVGLFAHAPDAGAAIHALATRIHQSIQILHNHRAPVVMAVQGAAAGAGLSLVAGADIALAGQSSSYLWAYAAIGLTCDGGASWNLPRVVGLRHAQELAFTGKRMLADEAAAIGLVTRVVPDDTLQEEALAVARKIAQGPTTSYGEVKKLFAAAQNNDLATQLALEAESMAAALRRPDGANAVRAFLDKRKPVFTGE